MGDGPAAGPPLPAQAVAAVAMTASTTRRTCRPDPPGVVTASRCTVGTTTTRGDGHEVRRPTTAPVVQTGRHRGCGLFAQFSQVVADASGWAYLILIAFAFLDALLPIVPSEASVITAGVVAANGDLSLPLVLLCAGVGAFSGDNTTYYLGRRFGERAEKRFFSGPRGQRRIAWAARQLRDRSGELIVVGRFIPGGRTAVALTAGTLRYPWRRFASFDVAAAALWAGYAGCLGYFGGRAFEDAPWKGLLLAFALALAITAATEAARHVIRRRRAHRAELKPRVAEPDD